MTTFAHVGPHTQLNGCAIDRVDMAMVEKANRVLERIASDLEEMTMSEDIIDGERYDLTKVRMLVDAAEYVVSCLQVAPNPSGYVVKSDRVQTYQSAIHELAMAILLVKRDIPFEGDT